MAHIANYLVDLDTSHISKQASHHPSFSAQAPPPPGKPFTWRMQPEPQRKYQLFPKERKLPVLNNNTNKAVDVEKPLPAITPDQQQQSISNGSMKRHNQHSIVRRRKVSVPDLGPMTTVHEVAMDSPTIPGRLPFHERSNSAPGNSSRKHNLTDTFFYDSDDDASDILSPVAESLYSRASVGPFSPKQLAPLMIPKSEFSAPRIRRQQSLNNFPAINESLRHDRADYSPRSRASLATPSSSLPDLSSPKSSTTATSNATIPTPVSASLLESRTASPKPWDGRFTPPVNYERSASAHGHIRGGSEPTITEKGRIIDRGRPKKRSNSRNNNMGPIIQRSESRGRNSIDQGVTQSQPATEKLPEGIKLSEAAETLDTSEIRFLQQQAVAQAERFEILRPTDVELLSRELRHLDERTEYLRRTYHSLRVGRRNLHSRICQYLRSPRVVKFSHESMLRQEEALAELDASIDDWVNKLEQAENRRTRVRQKLLEHVAAAATLSVGGIAPPLEAMQQTVGSTPSSGIGNIATPPRSPSKHSFAPLTMETKPSSPPRSVASVPSTIMEQPVVEGVASDKYEDRITSQGSYKRVDVESIRVYAGDDVYALLADVENEITRMSKTANLPSSELTPDSMLPEGKRIALNRQKSHEMLNGGSETVGEASKTDATRVTQNSPRGQTIARDDAPSMFILANTVYKP